MLFFFSPVDEKNLIIFWVSNDLGEKCQNSKSNTIFHEYLAHKIELWTAYRKTLLCLGFVIFEDANLDALGLLRRKQRKGRCCVPHWPIMVPNTFSGTVACIVHLARLRVALFLFVLRKSDLMSANRWRDILEMCRLLLENLILSRWQGSHFLI